MDKDKALEYLRGLEKLKASGVKSPDYSSPLEKDVMKVMNLGGDKAQDAVTKIKNATQKIDTKEVAPILSGSDFMKKIEALRAAKAGKKMLGALPLVGAGIAALQGDPAMAAEELAMDLPGAEAIRSESVGESPEEEAEMLAERDARMKYKESPAAKASKLAKLKALMGK